MYIAELRGKLSKENENREDILTSNVFSFLKYVDRLVFLYPLLKSLVPDITPAEAQCAEFYFWPQYQDGTEPDLVLITSKYYFLIEAKYHSGFGQANETVQHQLVREVQNGRYEAHNLGKSFKLVAVTSHYSFSPSLYNEVPLDARSDFIWINWGRIALLLEMILYSEPLLSPETRLFANDLHALLVRKNLRFYSGQQFLFTYPKIQSIEEVLFFDAKTAEYRGDFFGFMNMLETQPKLVQLPATIFYRYPSNMSRSQIGKGISKRGTKTMKSLMGKHFEDMDAVPSIPSMDYIFFGGKKHGQS
jgi:hypothetical protein